MQSNREKTQRARWTAQDTSWVLVGLLIGFGLAIIGLWLLGTRVGAAGALETRVAEARPFVSYDGELIADGRSAATPCWSNGRKPHPSCTPTPFPPSPTDTAVPNDTPTATATAIAPPTGTAVPPGTPTPCAGPDPYWSCVPVEQFEAEVARLINLHRASPPHDPWYESGIALDLRADLSTAERLHAQEMVATDQCIHGDFGTRAAEQGYTGWAWGNIGACGYPNPAEAVQGWIDSPAHHWIMDEANAMTEFGVGMAFYENGFASVWVTIGCGGGIPCMAATTGHP